MNPKLLKFIVLMTIVSVLVWIAGEVVIVAVMKLGGAASIVWSIVMLAVIIALSMWKSFKSDDDSDKRNW
ncbi:MAG: hypothetical protein ACI4JB_10430 [Porcipelethomonas sp.]